MPSGAEHFEDLLRRAQARLGRTIDDKWKLEALLGVGGMAAVYAGTHRNGKRGAVKVLHQEEALDPSVKARFLREGFVANKVGHSGIAGVIDDDEASDGTVYLVMELLEGESLETRCPPGKTMATGDVLSIANQLLDVLIAAHDHGIVHRDLKPSNLFLLPDGTLKVLDFGIARLRELAQGESERRIPTTTLSALGTPGFMPPEQARGRWEDVDGRSDIWAVGATMFTLLTGASLHEEDATLNEQLLAAMTTPCPTVASVSAGVPESVAAIVDRALAFTPDDRWQDAASMQAAVREAYRTLTGRPLSFTGGPLATRLSIPELDPDLISAPTLAAAPTPSDRLLRAASSKAAVVMDDPGHVTGGPVTLGNARGGNWTGAALLFGAACIGAGLFAFFSGHAGAPAQTAAATASTPAVPSVVTPIYWGSTPAASGTSVSASASAPAPSTSPSSSDSAEKPAGSAITRNQAPRPKASGSASAHPASSNDVDIFNRRR